MRGFGDYRMRLATAVAAVALASMLGACGDDECNHVIYEVPTFEACQEIAVERQCSPEITYSRANLMTGKKSRCKVERCGDCDGGIATPSVTPGPSPTPTIGG